MSGFKDYKKISVVNPLVRRWLEKLPPDRFVLAHCYIITLVDDVGLPEAVAAEVVYKTATFCVAQGANGNGK